MLQATVAIAPPRATAHHEDAHGRLLVDPVDEPLDPAVKPAPAQHEESFCEIPINRSRVPEVHLAGMA